jgi:hypothetical protein
MMRSFMFHVMVRMVCLPLVAVMVPLPLHAQPGFTTISTVRLDVKYQRGVGEAGARKVADYLQSDYEYLSTTLGLDLGSRLEVRIYDAQGKYLEATGQKKPWRFACFHGGMIHVQPVSVLEKEGAFEKSLSYELALALLDGTIRKGCPLWLREAYAVYHSGIMSDLTVPVGARVNSFGDLDEDLQQYKLPPRRLDVLYLLAQTMKYFIDQYGEARAIGVFKAFTGTRSTEKVMAAHFGVELPVIEKGWSEYIASHSVPFRTPR